MEKSKKIIDKIKKEDIQPIPKWYFRAKNSLVWLAFTISLFIGAAAFSVILYSIQQTEFNLLSHLSHSGLELFLGLLPFFWIIALLLFLVLAIVSIQKSKKGYKLNWARWVGFSIAISILLGTLFFIGGGARWLDHSFAEQVGLYEGIEAKKMKIWMNPEDGFLAGTIEQVVGDVLHLVDFDQKKWEVNYAEAFIPPAVFLETAEQVKLVGKITGTNSFRAEEVRPWGGKQQQERMKKKMQKGKQR